MRKAQLHRRLPREFIGEVLEAFNGGHMKETQACGLLGIQRTRLYELRRDWLRARKELPPSPARKPRTYPTDVEAWLHAECQYIREHAGPFHRRFNFAVLAEAAERRFPRRFDRGALRAQRQGYYQGTRAEVAKVYLRFETAGPGVLF